MAPGNKVIVCKVTMYVDINTQKQCRYASCDHPDLQSVSQPVRNAARDEA